VLSLPGWEVIGFDSHQDNSVGAHVSAQDRGQLEAACLAAAAAGKNVLLATHHPPLDVNCPWLDKDRIQNGAELLEWLSEHTTVCAMVFGHAHQVIEQQAGATRRISLHGTPSTCFQFAPETRTFAIDEAEPGYRWLELHADGEVTTRVRRVHYPMQIELPGRQA
jgi:Icc protein